MTLEAKKITGSTLRLVVLLVILFLGSVYEYQQMLTRTLRTQAYDSLTKLGSVHRELVTARLDGQFSTLESIAGCIASMTEPTREQAMLVMNGAVQSGEFLRLGLSSPDGTSLTNDGQVHNNSHRDYFLRALGGESVVSEPLASIIDGTRVIVLAVPVTAPDGNVLGVLRGTFSADALGDLLLAPFLKGSEAVLLVDGDGEILTACWGQGKQFTGTNILRELESARMYDNVTLQTIERDLHSGVSRSFRATQNGGDLFLSYLPLGLNDWNIVTSSSGAAISQESKQISTYVYSMSGKLLLGFLVLIVYVLWSSDRRAKAMEAEKERLRMSEERYRIVTSLSDSAIFEYNVKDNLLVSAEKFVELFGWALRPEGFPASLERSGHIHPDDLANSRKAFQSSLQGERFVKEEVRVKTVKGKYLWCMLRLTAVLGPDKKPLRVIGKFSNIDRQKQETMILRDKAEKDSLTGVYNKRTAQNLIDEFLHTEAGTKGRHALMIVDIDNFKSVNDTLGHIFGDAVLTEICQEMGRLLYQSDLLGRIGGDEFVVFLRDMRDEQHIRDMASQICQVFRRSYAGRNRDYKISGSVGIAVSGEGACGFEELYRRADIALYTAKRNGKDQYSFYNSAEFSDPAHTPGGDATAPIASRGAKPPPSQGDLRGWVFELLYEARDFDSSVNLVLSMLGERFRCARVTVLALDESGCNGRELYIWFYEDEPASQADSPLILTEHLQDFVEKDVCYCQDLTTLPPEHAGVLLSQGCCAVLQVGMMDGGDPAPWGLIQLDCLAGSPPWSEKEMDTLIFLCRMLGMFILRHK